MHEALCRVGEVSPLSGRARCVPEEGRPPPRNLAKGHMRHLDKQGACAPSFCDAQHREQTALSSGL